MDETRTKLAETTLYRKHPHREDKASINTLAAGLHQVTQPEMGVILQVTEGEI